jgi:4'-phosphopantetheinyl transferase
MDVFWLEQRMAETPASDEWLSPWEASRLHALKIQKRRADWRLGRWTAKCPVAGLLEISEDLASIEISADARGAPTVLVSGEALGINKVARPAPAVPILLPIRALA